MPAGANRSKTALVKVVSKVIGLSVPTCLVSKRALVTAPKAAAGASPAPSGLRPLTVATVVPSYILSSPWPKTQALAFSVPPPVRFTP